MARIVKLPVHTPEKLGHRKARRRKIDLEDYGQLNLFAEQARVVQLGKKENYFEAALSADEAGETEQAIILYQKAIASDQHLEDAYCNLAILRSAKEESAGAIDALTKCLALNSRHFEAHYNLGNVYSEVGNLELARIHYELATQIAPNYPNSFYNLGLVLISLKKFKDAIESINRYLELEPQTENHTAKELLTTLNAIAQ